MTTTVKLMVCAGCSLAALFAGNWIVNALTIPVALWDDPDLMMRFSALTMYLLLLAITLCAARAFGTRWPQHQRHFILILSAIGLILSCFGVMLLHAIAGGLNGWYIGIPAAPTAIALFLAQSADAPLTAALLTLLARIPRRYLLPTVTFGTLGGFIIESFCGLASDMHVFPMVNKLLLTGFLLMGGFALLMLGYYYALHGGTLEQAKAPYTPHTRFGQSLVHIADRLHLKDRFDLSRNDDSMDVFINPASNRAFAQSLDKRQMAHPYSLPSLLWQIGTTLPPRFVVITIVSTIILGFMHSSSALTFVYTSPITVGLIVLLSIAALSSSIWNIRDMFSIAFICTAAGILFETPLTTTIPNAPQLLTSTGSALFEIAVVALSVRYIQSSTQIVLAAVSARLITIFGHFLGSMLGTIAMSSSSISVSNCSLFIVFVYLLLVLSLYRHSGSNKNQSPELSASKLGSQPQNVEGSIEPVQTTTTPLHSSNVPGQLTQTTSESDSIDADTNTDTRTFTEDTYWDGPCQIIANKYQLTARETDVLKQLARGRTLNAIADEFVLSSNTIKMHIKHIYQKLDVHSKQDVIKLVDITRDAAQNTDAQGTGPQSAK
ncbi:MAG: helix-turn-helix transcriptional regulator [Eggerthellaceae bacterium]|jgi:DNA-binding CsgD family transcriptional regulator/MFS family permease|nr:helix-turn-helix transcriptional regulator [Eggerthellaceae bacterium]